MVERLRADEENYAAWRAAKRGGTEFVSREAREMMEQEERERADEAYVSLDEAEARMEADREYENAYAEVFRYEDGSPTISMFSREKMRTLKRGDVLRFDHAGAEWDVVGYDAENDVVTLVPAGMLDNPLMSDAELAADMVKYAVSPEGAVEIKETEETENGREDQGRAAENLAGDAAGEGGGARTGGARGEGGSAAPGSTLESATADTIKAEELPQGIERRGSGYAVRGMAYRSVDAAKKALEKERTIFRQGDTVALKQDGETLTGTVSRAPDGSLSVRVREPGRNRYEPAKVRDVKVKDAKNLTKLIDGGARFKGGAYDPRSQVPAVRGGWSEKKILKYLNQTPSRYGLKAASRLIAEFDSPEELKAHMFYHGTRNSVLGLSPSITKSEAWAEKYGGGGYGQRYWGISLSKDKTVSVNFGDNLRGTVSVYPVVLAKGAKVVERRDFSDAIDIEDHIVEFWNDGVDAVWIGDKDKGEQELCVLNPRAICNIGTPDFYRLFKIGQEENPINIKNDAQIAELYEAAKDYASYDVHERFGKPKKPSAFTPGYERLKPKDVYNAEMSKYESDLAAWSETEQGRAAEEYEYNARNTIRFKSTLSSEEERAVADRILAEKPIVSNGRLLAMSPSVQRVEARRIYDGYKSRSPIRTLDGRDVNLTSRGFKEVKQHSADPHTLALVDILPEVISSMHYIGDGDLKPTDVDIKAYHLYARRVNLGDGEMVARVVVREDVNGDIFYDEESTTLETLREIVRQATRKPNARPNGQSPYAPHSISDFFYRVNRGRARTAFKAFKRGAVSPAEDAAYMDAVERGDTEAAQRMVREAAKNAGYKVAVFHGTPSGGFNVFKTLPAYVSENKEYADIYQSTSASSIRFGKQATMPETKALLLDPRRMFDTRRKAVRERFFGEYAQGGEEWTPVSGMNVGLSKRGLPDWTEAEAIADYIRAKHLPYDSIVVDEGGYPGLNGEVQDRGVSYAVLKSSKLKSGDAVTYDDAGNVIPLSQRFNPESGDIRFKRGRAPMEDPIVSNIRERLKFGRNYDPADAHHIAYSASRDEIALFRDHGDGEYDIIARVKATDENHKRLLEIRDNLADADADAYLDLVNEAQSLAGNNGISGGLYSADGAGAGEVRAVAGADARDGRGEDSRQGEGDSGGIRWKSASADDTDYYFGAKESFAAHGRQTYTAKDLGISTTNKAVLAAAHRYARDFRRVKQLMDDAILGKERTYTPVDVVALTVKHRDLQHDMEDVLRRMEASGNPEGFQTEKELIEAQLDNVAKASSIIGSKTGQTLRAFRVGLSDDIRDSEAYILQSMRVNKQRKGFGSELTDAEVAAAKRMAAQLKAENDKLKAQIAELEAKHEKELEAKVAVNDGQQRSQAKARTLSKERRAKAEAATGIAFSDNNAAGFAALEGIFGKALSFKGGGGDAGSTLTDEMAQGFSALLEGHSFDEIEKVIRSQMPKAMSAWAQFRRQNERKSAAELAELAQPITARRPRTTKDLAAAREDVRRKLDENAEDPRQQRIALGHYLRRFRDALINENPDIPMKELNERMAEEATALTGTKHDPVAMLAVSAGADGYDLETRAEMQRKMAKARRALDLFRQGRVNEAARESGLLYEDEATALAEMEDALRRLMQEKADEIDVLSTFSEGNREAVERVRKLKADIEEANDALKAMRKDISLAERKRRFAEVLEKRLAEAQANADALRGEVESDGFRERRAKAEERVAELKDALAVARRDENTLERIQGRIAELERRIADGDYDRQLLETRANDAELQAKIKLQRERRNALRRKLDAERRARNYREMGIIGKTLYGLGGILGEMKGVVASFDLSSVLRQGGQLTWAHPFVAAKNLKETLKALKSAENADNLMTQLRMRPNWQYYEKAGVDFTDWGEGAQNKEDVYLLNQYRKITSQKLLKAGVEASERAEVGGIPKTFVTGFLTALGANVQAFDPYNFKQLKGDFTYFRSLYDKATDPEEKSGILRRHPMLKCRKRIEDALKRVRDLEKIRRDAEKRGAQPPADWEQRVKDAKQKAVDVMAGFD